jgi:dTDP-N-acetylfucosamine:lipid II N-acetylfucosaminyltransferase
MRSDKTLHICRLDKFIPPFIDLIKENFTFSKHDFLLFGSLQNFPTQLDKNIIHINHAYQIFELIFKLNKSKKIILHSLFNPIIVLLLFLQPWLLKKCYWIMWGGDLYYYKFRDHSFKTSLYESIRRFVIKRIGHLVTYFQEEYEIAQEWYRATGVHHACFSYPSNIFNSIELEQEAHDSIHIQIGNSATPSNQHVLVLKKLAPFKDLNIKIFIPLSYGDTEYAQQVIQFGRNIFGEKVIPLEGFMPLDAYKKHLSAIDIAIFNNNRQQAVGNIISLLGFGKKVFMRSDVSSWKSLSKMGLTISDINNLEITKMDLEDAIHNKNIISASFSKTNLIHQLESIFI